MNEAGSVTFLYRYLYLTIMPLFLARRRKTKTKRPVSFKTGSGQKVSFRARRKPQRRSRVSF